MKLAENNLVRAVRDRLRQAGFAEQECDAEPSEMAPATVGKVYAAVIPAGWRPGPRHNTSGGVNDLVYAVKVAVIRRVTEVPRDRKRDIFLANLESLTADVDRVFEAIDWVYDVINLANAKIAATNVASSTYGFSEPLRLVGDVGPIRDVGPEFFGGAAGDTVAGMMRVLPFGGARRITPK
jgi:hypothetical protein